MHHKYLSVRHRTVHGPAVHAQSARLPSTGWSLRHWVGALLLALAAVWLTVSAAQAAEEAVGDNAVLLPGFAPSTSGGMLDLSGYFEVPYAAALNPSGGSLTIEAWVKRNETNRNETLVGNGYQTSYWLGFSSTGKLRFIPHGADSIVDSNVTVPAGAWTHVAVTYDGVTRKYYINGILDQITTDKPGALAPAPAGESLHIGFDRDDNFDPNYFAGWIDTLRIWNTVRDAADIQANLYQTIDGPAPNLLAEWPFNGNANDTTGIHHATPHGANVRFGNEGAIPHDIRIPQVEAVPTLNGRCTDEAYANAVEVTVDGTSVKLLHTAADLWVCFDGLGDDNDRALVYLDPAYTRMDPAQVEHIVLSIKTDDSKLAQIGDGTGVYSTTSAFDTLWEADYTICCGEFPSHDAEFRISGDLVNGWSHVMGLALGKSTGLRAGLDLWPARAVFNLPSTWSNATLAGTGPPRSFSGRVVYQAKGSGAPESPIPGVRLALIGRDPSGSEAVVATAQSRHSGGFLLTTTDDFAEHRLELDTYQLPKGYLPKQASAETPGVVGDARTIDYTAAGGGEYGNIQFTLTDALPAILDVANGPYFLIITSAEILNAGALTAYVDFKFRQGFSVETISVEAIDAAFAGPTRLERIRALEQARLNTLGSRFRYVMLIGSMDVIPFARLPLWITGVGDQTCAKLDAGAKYKYSEWLYVDLESNFDSNGNGCYADGLWSKPEDRAPGYTPDANIQWKPTVALGRLPFDTPATVQTVLQNIMAFEQQTDSFKTRSVWGTSLYAVKGWMYEGGITQPCADKWSSKCVSATSPPSTSFDTAYMAEVMKSDFLNANQINTTVFYENEDAVAGGAPFSSPQLLTEENLVAELKARQHGLVEVVGHGNSSGVYRTHWKDDTNSNGRADLSTPPPSTNEIGGGVLLTKNGMMSVSADNGRGSVYIMTACSTAAPTNVNNFAATLLKDGHGVAAIGALNVVTVGSWTQADSGNAQSTTYYVTNYMLNYNLRLGDAFWQALAARIAKGSRASGEVAIDLYGDPTVSYWGNPGGESTLAAWPMLRQNPLGQGRTTLVGPGVPKKAWEYGGAAPVANTLAPSPIVSNNGEVIVAHGNQVDVLRNGTLYQRLELDAPAFGTPALATDGTIYVLDVTGKLYAFDRNYLFVGPLPPLGPLGRPLGPVGDSAAVDAAMVDGGVVFGRYRRWAVSLGQAPHASPIIGADGLIAVAYGAGNSTVALVRGDGFVLPNKKTLQGRVTGALAVGADRRVYAMTNHGGKAARYRLVFSCVEAPVCETSTVSTVDPGYSTPPLLAYGALYAGNINGVVQKFSTSILTVQNSFQADSAIVAGPVAGPAGQILVGSQNGTLYSLTQELSLRWQRTLGTPINSVPAFSHDALYVAVGGQLRAFSPWSGAPLWSRSLEGATHGSTAINYGRELIVQTNGGNVLAFTEGWKNAIVAIGAEPVHLGAGRHAIQVYWVENPLPQPGGGVSSAEASATDGMLLLQRRAGESPWEDRALLPPGTAAFTDTAVTDESFYTYRIQVLGGAPSGPGNDSDFTTTHQSVQTLPALPGAPTLDAITPLSSEALQLQWTAPAGATVATYQIERAPDGGGPFTVIAQVNGQTTTLIDEGLAAATTYHYRLTASNDNGPGNPSNVVSGTTYARTLDPPTGLLAELLPGGQIQLSWQGGPAGAQAVVEVSTFGLEGFDPVATVDAAGPYLYGAGEPNAYDFRVKFVLGADESPYAETSASIVTGVLEEAMTNLYLPVVMK